MNDEHPWDDGIPLSDYELIEAERYGRVASDPQLEARIKLENATARKHEAERATILAKIEFKKLEVVERRLENESTELRLALLKEQEAVEAARDERDAARLETNKVLRTFGNLFRIVTAEAASAVTDREMHAALDKLGAEEKIVCQACRGGWAISLNGRMYCPHCSEEGDAVISEPPF